MAYDDGSRAHVARFEDAYAAVGALEGFFDSPGRMSSTRTNAHHFTRGNGALHDGTPFEVFAWTEGPWLFAVEAKSATELEARMDRLVFLRRTDGLGPSDPLHGRLPLLIIGLIAWIAIMIPIWTRTASWAAVVAPSGAARAVDRAELERRLRALDIPGGPFTVQIDRGYAVIEWRIGDPN